MYASVHTWARLRGSEYQQLKWGCKPPSHYRVGQLLTPTTVKNIKTKKYKVLKITGMIGKHSQRSVCQFKVSLP